MSYDPVRGARGQIRFMGAICWQESNDVGWGDCERVRSTTGQAGMGFDIHGRG